MMIRKKIFKLFWMRGKVRIEEARMDKSQNLIFI